MGNLRTAQADAMTEADRGIAELERQYQANVSSAIADNDYQRAQALLSEYNNGYSRDLNTAKTLAAYGDFSGYASLYGQETANNMAALWKAKNPDLAYNTGRMNAEEYKAITGQYPAGYIPPHKSYNPTPGTGPDPEPDPETVSDFAKYLSTKIATGMGREVTEAINYVLENSDKFNDKEIELISNASNSGRDIYWENKYTAR